jgi:hypothetical protein
MLIGKVLFEILKGTDHLRILHTKENINMDLKETECEGVEWNLR